jgi:hypothetical protein
MLLNRTCCSDGWPQEGIYVTFNADVADPKGWSEPVKILDGPKKGFFGGFWYPQVLGTGPDLLPHRPAGERDRQAGRPGGALLPGRAVGVGDRLREVERVQPGISGYYPMT